ncbi:MAG: class I SAM-dependent methyltransferase, partial [Candidatus Peribacteraceae bacterium]
MTELFKGISDQQMVEVIDPQLKLQVDVPWPQEAECLESHGLAAAKSVLDIGTGNGYFLCRLAERYPDKEFVGVELNEVLVRCARAEIERRKLRNVTVLEARCPAEQVKAGFDFAFARLALYATPESGAILEWALARLNEGGRFAAIDLDFDRCYAFPASEAWTRMFKCMSTFGPPHGLDFAVGAKLPHMLLQAGFRDIRFEQRHWFSSIGMSSRDFVSYWKSDAAHVRAIMPDLFSQADMEL